MAQSIEVGLIQQTPVPDLSPDDERALAHLAHTSWSLKRSLDTPTETSHALTLPALLQVEGASLSARASAWTAHAAEVDAQLADLQAQIDDRCFALYGINAEDRASIERGFGGPTSEEPADDEVEEEDDSDADDHFAALISWAVGVAFGRFDLRLATGARPTPPEPDPFAPLPPCSPGMLTGDDGLPVAAPPPGYPIPFPTDGVLVDDPGAPRDLLAAVRQVFGVVFGEAGDERLAEAVALLDPRAEDLRPWLRSTFFAQHIQRYSKSRRKAPIYWRLGTPSGSYSVWLYIHRMGRDTLHAVLRDHVEPKLRYEEERWQRMQAAAGASTSDRKALAAQEGFVEELRAMRDELLRVAPLWSPDLDDGVVINASFLHRLFLHTKPWAKECEAHWGKLRAREYDWSHLAMRLWPEWVAPKCAEDRSLAIAHGVEDLLWVEEGGRWRPRERPDDEATRRVLALAPMTQTVGRLRAWAEAQGGLDWPGWWAGRYDSDELALELFPARVLHRMQREPALAAAHGRPAAFNPARAHDPGPVPEETGRAGTLVRALAVAVGRTPAGQDLFAALDAGELDSCALALFVSPERVIAACRADRELAEQHEIDGWFWVNDGGSRPRRDPDEEVAAIVAARRSLAVQQALKEVASAPPPVRAPRAPAPKAPKPPPERPPQRDAQLPLDLRAPPRVDTSALDALRAALHRSPEGANKAELLAASGLEASAWGPAIQALIGAGEVEQTGQARGTKYRLRGGS